MPRSRPPALLSIYIFPAPPEECESWRSRVLATPRRLAARQQLAVQLVVGDAANDVPAGAAAHKRGWGVGGERGGGLSVPGLCGIPS